MTDARAAVLRQLAEAYDRFAEEAQVLVGEGRYTEAEAPNAFAILVLRAFRLESDDPEPRGLVVHAMPDHPHYIPIPGCARCEGVPS